MLFSVVRTFKCGMLPGRGINISRSPVASQSSRLEFVASMTSSGLPFWCRLNSDHFTTLPFRYGVEASIVVRQNVQARS